MKKQTIMATALMLMLSPVKADVIDLLDTQVNLTINAGDYCIEMMIRRPDSPMAKVACEVFSNEMVESTRIMDLVTEKIRALQGTDALKPFSERAIEVNSAGMMARAEMVRKLMQSYIDSHR